MRITDRWKGRFVGWAILSSITAAGGMVVAQAQPMGDHGPRPGPPEGRHDRPMHGGPMHRDMHDAGRPMPPPDRGFGPEHRFHRGDHLPAQWRDRQYVVDDWRAHHLNAPPRGYHWVQVGADYALVAIATGVITSFILNQ